MSHVPWYASFSMVTCKWVMSHMNESCHVTMSYATYAWVMSHDTSLLIQFLDKTLRNTHFYKTDTQTSTKQTHRLLQNRHTHFYKTDTHTSTKQTHRLLQNRHTHFCKTDTQTSTKQRHRLLLNIDLDQDSHSNRFSSLPRISEKRTPLQSTDRWQYSRALHCRKRALCFQRRLPQEPYISAKEICILAKEPYITAKEP